MGLGRFTFHPRQKHIVDAILNYIHLHYYENPNNPLLLEWTNICPTSRKNSFYNVIDIMLKRGWLKRDKHHRYYMYKVSWETLELEYTHASGNDRTREIFVSGRTKIFGSLYYSLPES